MKRWLRSLAGPLTRDKADTLLLIGAALLALLPHAAHLPGWISGVCAATLAWRALITLRGTRMPPLPLLLPIALGAMAGIHASFNTLLGRDAGVAMLVLLVAFKMLEMHARRDLFVVVFLCLFIVLTNFFYSQSIGTAVLMAAAVIALLTAQLSFQFGASAPPLGRRLRMGATMFALAAPLAVFVFVFFPRVQGPLWGMPGDAYSGRSGLSDSMAPGTLASLAQSDEAAFRVRFLNGAPARRQLYWRAIVLANYDGRNWTRVRRQGSGPRPSAQVRGAPLAYQLTLEPGNGRHLAMLELPARAPELGGNPVSVSAELEMSTAYPVQERLRYVASAYTDYALQAGVLPEPAQWLLLPQSGNPLALAWAAQLARLRDPVARVNTVLRRFHDQGYVYTLEPPLLGRDSIDGFLFGSRAGFCEHYAGAFVFLMRAAGVPARVVTGYQGGEYNPVDGYFTVRQSDAHAWAEVWLPARGWVRVDPTAAVAPERVEKGAARSLQRNAPFGIEGLGQLLDLRNADSPLGRLRLQLAALNNGWNQWVLNYTPERQRGLMDILASLFANLRTLAALAAAALLLLWARELRRRRQRDPIDALYFELCRQLARRGAARQRHEGPTAYAARLRALGGTVGNLDAITRFLALYSGYRYGAARPDPQLAATMKSLLNQSR